MAAIYGTYSFSDFTASINGPGGGFIIGGPDTATAEEGLTVTWGEENNTQNIGADGSIMNSMHAARAGTIAVRLQKISPVNFQLSQLWNYQRQSSIFWGQNVITMRQVMLGDLFNNAGCAFVRFPTIGYPKVANLIEWEFHVAVIDPYLGPGVVFTGV